MLDFLADIWCVRFVDLDMCMRDIPYIGELQHFGACTGGIQDQPMNESEKSRLFSEEINMVIENRVMT